MIKLIASDLDGTLLPEGTQEINPELYDTVRALSEKGIIFVAASGRDIETMKTVVNPIAEHIYCISNNGGMISRKCDETLELLTLDWQLVKKIISDVRKDKKIIFMSASTPEGTYTDIQEEKALEWLTKGYGMSPIIVDDLLERELKVMKINVLVEEDAGDIVDPYIEKYGDVCHVTVAGAKWVDFTHTNADKGLAFKKLIEMLNIKPEETWAFGDNANDLSMLKEAGKGFAAPGAREIVTREADECLQGRLWDSVINKMKSLL